MNAPKPPPAEAAHAGQRAPSPELRDTRTHENLRAAFAVDAQAVEMWAYFGRIAEVEGYPDVARTFREIADAQAVVAGGHLDFLMRAADPIAGRPLGDTAQNVAAALAAQRADGEGIPDMARTARAEGFMDIASWFDTVARTRAHHGGRLDAALVSLKGKAS
jgi:rubrerythrin